MGAPYRGSIPSTVIPDRTVKSDRRQELSYPGGTVESVLADDDTRYRAVQSRDDRFDGWFVTAVTSTGIYCRPSCPAMTPRREHVRFFPSAAAAQQDGFRACKRCRPDATPGSPDWDLRADLVGRAMRLIGDGVVDREGVTGLASRLGYSERHLHRQLWPRSAPGRWRWPGRSGRRPPGCCWRRPACRSPTSRSRPGSPASGSSTTRSGRCSRRRRPSCGGPGAVRPSGRRRRDRAAAALPGADRAGRAAALPRCAGGAGRGGLVRRGLHPLAAAAARTGGGGAVGRPRLRALRAAPDRPARPGRGRAAQPAAARPRRRPGRRAGRARGRPAARPAGPQAPGLRVPGHVDGAEMAVRAVARAAGLGARRDPARDRLAEAYGEPLASPPGSADQALPDPRGAAGGGASACRRPGCGPCARWPARWPTASSTCDPGADRAEAERRLLGCPASARGPRYLALRALRDPDVFLPTDVGVRHALDRLGVASDPAAAAALAERWRPWRSYGLLQLWHSLGREDV